MNVFTNQYPGVNRITIVGSPDSDCVVLKLFCAESRRAESKTGKYFRRRVSTYPAQKKLIHRNGLARDEFIALVESECIKFSAETKTVVCDEGSMWGFYERQQHPFNDAIPF